MRQLHRKQVFAGEIQSLYIEARYQFPLRLIVSLLTNPQVYK